MNSRVLTTRARFGIGTVLVALGTIAGLVFLGTALAAAVSNGNFETGDLSGWTAVDSGSGNWSVYSGISSPISGQTIAAPPEGTFAATTDQAGPGSFILYQDLTLEPGLEHTLSFTIYYENRAGVFHTPASLSEGVYPNQQYRVDIIDPAAPVDSVAAGDVLANVFQTEVGDPASLAPTPIYFDLTSFAGSTVRLRFAQVDNQYFFQASVDDVRLESVSLDGDGDVVPDDANACAGKALPDTKNPNGQGKRPSHSYTNNGTAGCSGRALGLSN